MADWIADTFTSDLGWNHLGNLIDIGNRTAGPTSSSDPGRGGPPEF